MTIKATKDANCTTCHYALRGEPVPTTLQRQWFCMRFPPQVVVVQLPQGTMLQNQMPTVTEKVVCGEWRTDKEIIT